MDKMMRTEPELPVPFQTILDGMEPAGAAAAAVAGLTFLFGEWAGRPDHASAANEAVRILMADFDDLLSDLKDFRTSAANALISMDDGQKDGHPIHPALRTVIGPAVIQGRHSVAVTASLASLFEEWTSASDKGTSTKEMMDWYSAMIRTLEGVRPSAEEALHEVILSA